VPRLILVTDRRWMGGDVPGAVARALGGAAPGTTWVQLREKDLGGKALFELAAAVVSVCRAAGAKLLVNDRIDVALAVGADGVHLPEDGVTVAVARQLLGGRGVVGASAHSPEGAAARNDADLVALAPIWEVPGKGPPLGVDALARARAGVRGELIALGGVTPARAAEARRAGADGVAAIRAVWCAADPAAAVAELLA